PPAGGTVPSQCSTLDPSTTPLTRGIFPCQGTFEEQMGMAYPGMPGIGPGVAGTCHGYLVWVEAPQLMVTQYLCAYDPGTHRLIAAESCTDTGGSCWGDVQKIPQSCFDYKNIADAGAAD